MLIEIPYSNDILKVRVPEEHVLDIIEPVEVEAANEEDEFKKALLLPIDSPSFTEFISSADDLLIIVNDAQRPICTLKILDFIWDSIKQKRYKFIIATGSHNEPSKGELKQIFGKYINMLNSEPIIHKSKNDSDMVHLGYTSNGTPVKINRQLFECRKVLTITTIEPHNFAGYTGGRKSILPGIAAYETIEGNHKLALKKGAENLLLKGNPVHEDMSEALGFIAEKEIFTIQVVMDKHQRIYKTFTGNINGALEYAAKAADEIYSVKVGKKADIIVAVPFSPLDASLYQAHKAIENAKPILAENGILILAAACQEGIGQDNFYKLLKQYSNPDDMLVKFETSYQLGEHKAAKIAKLQKWAEIWTVSEMNPELLHAIRFRPYNSLQSAIDEALMKKGEDAKISFLLDGGITVPRVF